MEHLVTTAMLEQVVVPHQAVQTLTHQFEAGNLERPMTSSKSQIKWNGV